MEIRQKTCLAKSSMVITILTLVLMVGALALIYFFDHEAVWAIIILLIVIIGICVSALLFMPLGVRLDNESLTVMFSCRYKDFPLCEIAEAKPFTDARKMWRLCGSGAFFGWWGWYSAKGVGKFMLYASNLQHLLLIQLTTGKKYVISCSDTDVICKQLNSAISHDKKR